VVEEVVYVLDVDAAMAVAGEVRKAAYRREDPQVASTILGVTRLAFPEQLVEIKFVAKLPSGTAA
jgi:enamine deaminase RidA (YjgF/YER057c/UK114 family)